MGVHNALAALKGAFGDRLATSGAILDHHAQSETYVTGGRPDAVVFPANTDEVALIARTCSAHRIPMVGWGAGTSLEGHALPLTGGLTLDFTRMDRLLEVRPEDMLAVVQPGITREALNTHLRDTGLFFPVDPGANASLGGMAATRASGTTAVRYGTMRANVLALEVVLADGRVIRTGSAAPKTSAGYDLTGLFVGSEGTLGLITELTLRLQGQPEAVMAAVCAFPSVAEAVDCVIATMQSGLQMARIELLDRASVAACAKFAGQTFEDAPHLLVEFHGSAAAVAEQVERFGLIAADFGSRGFQWAQATEDRNRLWKMRHQAYHACLALRPGATALVTDSCVPISRLAEAIAATQSDLADSPLMGPILGHVGDGNYHCILLIDLQNAAEVTEAKRLSTRMAERALALGGTVTGEHGIGMGKLGLMEAEHGGAWDVMGAVKRALDPLNLLNPGKVVRP